LPGSRRVGPGRPRPRFFDCRLSIRKNPSRSFVVSRGGAGSGDPDRRPRSGLPGSAAPDPGRSGPAPTVSGCMVRRGSHRRRSGALAGRARTRRGAQRAIHEHRSGRTRRRGVHGSRVPLTRPRDDGAKATPERSAGTGISHPAPTLADEAPTFSGPPGLRAWNERGRRSGIRRETCREAARSLCAAAADGRCAPPCAGSRITLR
jgi:hypothetical protein